MNEEDKDRSVHAAAGADDTPGGDGFDWRAVADERLRRLVGLEHDFARMRDRLSKLQSEHRELVLRDDAQRERARMLRHDAAQLEARLAAMARECQAVREEFLQSRSWRVTRPLRVLSVVVYRIGLRVKRVLRAMLRVPLLRRVARVLVRLVPGLHGRMRRMLYPKDGS